MSALEDAIKLYKKENPRTGCFRGIKRKYVEPMEEKEKSQINQNMKMDLEKIIQSHPTVLLERGTTKAVLSDVFGDNIAKINALMSAYDIGIVKAIEENHPVSSIFHTNLVSRLVLRYSMQEAAATWAVDTWVKIITPSVIGDLMSVRQGKPVGSRDTLNNSDIAEEKSIANPLDSNIIDLGERSRFDIQLDIADNHSIKNHEDIKKKSSFCEACIKLVSTIFSVVKECTLWFLTFYFFVSGIIFFPSVAAFLCFLIIAVIFPIGGWQKLVKRVLPRTWIKVVLTVALVIAAIVAYQPIAEEAESNSNVKHSEAMMMEYEDPIVAVSEKQIEDTKNEVIEQPVKETRAPVTMGEKNALKSAQFYLQHIAFSYTGLIEQLESEGYSHDEAVYAVENCGADWDEQAAKAAEFYLKYSAYSYTALIEQLEHDGFTYEQAVYGVEANGY